MSTDRELLEQAAQAAGLEYRWDGAVGMMRARLPGSGAAFPGWSPLTDDGDALRLAVKLRLAVVVWSDGETVSAARTTRDGDLPPDASSDWHATYAHSCGDDPAAATRRAIVLAAAQIGKTNQPGEADA